MTTNTRLIWQVSVTWGAEEEEEEEGEESEEEEVDLVAVAVTAGKQMLGKLGKGITQLMTDINVVGMKPRTEPLKSSATDLKEKMEATQKKLQAAVSKKDADKDNVDEIVELGEKYMDGCKTIHSEFKPHIDKKIKAKKAANK